MSYQQQSSNLRGTGVLPRATIYDGKLTLVQVASRLGLRHNTVISACRRGTIKAEKIGGYWYVTEAECHRVSLLPRRRHV